MGEARSGKVAVLAGGALVVGLALVGYREWGGQAPAPAPQSPAQPVLSPAPTPEPAPAPPQPAAPDLRLAAVPAADGLVTVAGQAPPGATVRLLVDDKPEAEVVALADGSFAAVLTLQPSDQPRVLSAIAATAEGAALSFPDVVYLPPMPQGQAPLAQALTLAGEAAAPAPAAPASAAPAGGEAPKTPVTLDVISYDAQGRVQFGGTGAAGAFVRLYLDKTPIADVGVGADGRWQAVPAEVSPGTYVLRLDQLDAEGKVTARLETPFLREPLERLAALTPPPAPEAAAPENQETAPQTPTDPAPDVSTPPATVTVQPGFTLWAIARDRLGEGVMYVQLFEANKGQIRDPDLIYPGQVFTIPKAPTP